VVDIASVHSTLDAPEPTALRSAKKVGLARDELLLDPGVGLDLLWRMLDTPREPHYVVSIEPLGARVKRLAGIAAQVADALGAARGGVFAGTAATRVAGARTDSGPTTPTEKLLLPLWEDAFGVADLGLDEDFFDLGGNSLVAVQLAVRIRDQFGVNMPGVAVLEYPTVRTLAQYVDASRAENTNS
jgi:acyl carrier protein